MKERLSFKDSIYQRLLMGRLIVARLVAKGIDKNAKEC